jgi:class 3 adenylate cyclase
VYPRCLRDGYADALAEHRRTLRAALAANGGVEVDTQGDAFLVAFSRARDADRARLRGRGLSLQAALDAVLEGG